MINQVLQINNNTFTHKGKKVDVSCHADDDMGRRVSKSNANKLISALGRKVGRPSKSLNSNLNFGNANREGRPGDKHILLYKKPHLPQHPYHQL
jgi:hypothetical protein